MAAWLLSWSRSDRNCVEKLSWLFWWHRTTGLEMATYIKDFFVHLMEIRLYRVVNWYRFPIRMNSCNLSERLIERKYKCIIFRLVMGCVWLIAEVLGNQWVFWWEYWPSEKCGLEDDCISYGHQAF